MVEVQELVLFCTVPEHLPWKSPPSCDCYVKLYTAHFTNSQYESSGSGERVKKEAQRLRWYRTAHG
jgi:hypothetical protein